MVVNEICFASFNRRVLWFIFAKAILWLFDDDPLQYVVSTWPGYPIAAQICVALFHHLAYPNTLAEGTIGLATVTMICPVYESGYTCSC